MRHIFGIFILLASFPSFAADLGQGVRISGDQVQLLEGSCLSDVKTQSTSNHMGFGGISNLNSLEWTGALAELQQDVESPTPEAAFVRRAEAESDILQNFSLSTIEVSFGSELAIEGRKKYSGSNWEKQCGQEFVSSLRSGAFAWVNIHLSLPGATEKEKAQCETDIYALDAVGTEVLSGSLEPWKLFASAPSCANGQITVSFLQVGGDITKVPKQFSLVESLNNHALLEVTCAPNEFETCASAVTELTNYIYGGNFLNSVDPSKERESLGGPAVTKIGTKKYSVFGIFP